jgi:hypothetical protein
MKKDSLLKTRLDKCPHCGVLIGRHMVYPTVKKCVYMQDEKNWLTINKQLDTKRSLSIRKVKNETD